MLLYLNLLHRRQLARRCPTFHFGAFFSVDIGSRSAKVLLSPREARRKGHRRCCAPDTRRLESIALVFASCRQCVPFQRFRLPEQLGVVCAVILVNVSFASLSMSTTTSKLYMVMVVQGAAGGTPDGYVQSAQP
ncbi:hypothetical protein CLAIMM_11152 [Cladophialophora immunda]|nr:hypothetical protein CLAIMM_11152 [Cladophialophora immunda]